MGTPNATRVSGVMSVSDLLLLLLAGVGTGLVGYLTGLASLVSYPALLAVGLPPVAANVTNTLALIGIGVGATTRSARLLAGRGRRELALQVVIALAGGATGASLLLLGGNAVFSRVVPWLVALASVALLVSPRLRELHGSGESRLAALLVLFPLCVYGGYFGAGAGVMYLATMLVLTADDLPTSMIVRSVLLGVSNLAASIVFIGFGPVNWAAAVALGVGCIAGGNLGPAVQRLIPQAVLRAIVAVCGLGLAVWLAVH